MLKMSLANGTEDAGQRALSSLSRIAPLTECSMFAIVEVWKGGDSKCFGFTMRPGSTNQTISYGLIRIGFTMGGEQWK